MFSRFTLVYETFLLQVDITLKQYKNFPTEALEIAKQLEAS